MIKTITFAACHFTVAFGVAYLLTGNISVSSLLALVEPACNTVAYYFHEKAWARFNQRKTEKETSAKPRKAVRFHHHFSFVAH